MNSRDSLPASSRCRWKAAALVPAILLLLPAPASAHTETGAIGGLISGFTHPLTGLDHLVAMVAVGLWGAFLGGRAIWMLPVAFPVVMAFGGALGVMKVPLPAVETGIALSGVILGLLVALAVKPPVIWAAVIVGIFGLLHGHAHGTELPKSASPMTYAIGFVVATGLLHLAGIALGLLVKWPWGKVVVRCGGAVIALIGLGFLFNFL
ncbi:MAG TPA: HupE/UreJ family protein [Methylomirabilota bacterium]|nr:HupE/UreJ family protein [Methylomirabilota bacterium]